MQKHISIQQEHDVIDQPYIYNGAFTAGPHDNTIIGCAQNDRHNK